MTGSNAYDPNVDIGCVGENCNNWAQTGPSPVGAGKRRAHPPSDSCVSSTALHSSRHNHLNLQHIPCQLGFATGPRRRVAFRHPVIPNRVHLGKIRHIRQPHNGLQDVLAIRSGLFKQCIHSGQAIPRLLRNGIARANLSTQVSHLIVDDNFGHPCARVFALNHVQAPVMSTLVLPLSSDRETGSQSDSADPAKTLSCSTAPLVRTGNVCTR
mmetsp:Transcript_5400/g.8546  ORF Transcript_5400/g.8546 Transcript_5400/m.8546 type:complete len:212 (-) Transcript_5400:165-800(-)